jgi:hypothetical protein
VTLSPADETILPAPTLRRARAGTRRDHVKPQLASPCHAGRIRAQFAEKDGGEAVRTHGFHQIKTQRPLSFDGRYKRIQTDFGRRENTMRKATMLVMTLFLLAGVGVAQKLEAQKIDLKPTDLGKNFEVIARATKGTMGNVEFLRVRVQAAMKDGTVIGVLIDTYSGQTNIPVGKITLLDGTGELQLQLASGPFSLGPLLHAADIQTVRLVDRYGGELAEGSF